MTMTCLKHLLCDFITVNNLSQYHIVDDNVIIRCNDIKKIFVNLVKTLTSIGYIVDYISQNAIIVNNIKIVVESYTKHNHISNEYKLIDMFNIHKPHTIVFDDGLHSYKIQNVNNVYKRDINTSRLENGLVNKEDLCITTNCGIVHPISIKMEGGSTWWESADGVYNDFVEKSICNLVNIYNINDYKSVNLKDIYIDIPHNMMLSCVYGNDIYDNGCVVVSNFTKYTLRDGILTIHTHRVFYDNSVLYDCEYSPRLLITKDKSRNKKRLYLCGLRVKISTVKRCNNAIKYSDIKKVNDFYK